MGKLASAWQRLRRSAVIWSWLMNGLRLASGLVVLPLLVHTLSTPDFGMYFVLLSLSSLVPILDLGFSSSIGRAVSYAMAGAKELKAEGFVKEMEAGAPNYELVSRLLHATRHLYRVLAGVTLLLLGVAGSIVVSMRVHETSHPGMTWAAWALTLIAAGWEIYAGWWNVFLRSMDQVTASTRLVVLGLAVKIAGSCVLLLCGAGLLSVPAATLLGSFVQRHWSRVQVLRLVPALPASAEPHAVRHMVATLWPNSWRIGLQYLSGFLAGQANTLVCQAVLGLAASATYGLSLQLMLLASSMAQVWTLVKWPQVSKLRIKHDNTALQKLLWPRVWLQTASYILMATGVWLLIPLLLKWTDSGKTVLPPLWLGLLAINGLFEVTYIFWGTLISTENRTPFAWPIIISNAVSFVAVLILLQTSSLGLAAFVIAPLAIGLLCNYWRWAKDGAHSLGTTWWRFMFRRPSDT
jgi:O-antigen/teichoic acid export membrane protein